VDERVKELLALQEQVFLARFKRSSRFVGLVMKGLGLSFRFPLVFELMSLYIKFFHFGIREFLSAFDGCIRNGNREKNVLRTALLLTGRFAMINKQEPGPIVFFSRVDAEFFEGYIGSRHEVELFSDANQACANELFVISEGRDSAKLRLFLTSIFQFAQQAHGKGQDRFLNIPPAACLILCQENVTAHRWLIGEAIPEAPPLSTPLFPPGSLQKRACKTFVECLIIGKQYGLTLPRGAPRQRVEQHLQSLSGPLDSCLHPARSLLLDDLCAECVVPDCCMWGTNQGKQQGWRLARTTK
jgi:hypothetical protein